MVMNRFVSKLIHEFIQALPTTMLFFASFQVIAYTRDIYLTYQLNLEKNLLK